jgi:hypothetical protein
MPYEFRPWDEELEPQPSSAHLGLPPRKPTGIDVVDPPGPLAGLPAPFLMRLLGVLILAGLGLLIFALLFAR